MNRALRIARATTAALAAAGMLGLAGPALAATQVTTDAPHDMHNQADLQSVRIAYNDTLRVTLTHQDLTRHGAAGGRIYFDTNPDRPGPEYAMSAGLFDGTDYSLWHARSNWQFKGNTPLSDCDYRLRLRYAKDTSVITVDPACFNDPAKVRVGVQLLAGTKTGTQVDWLTGKHTFSDWVDHN